MAESRELFASKATYSNPWKIPTSEVGWRQHYSDRWGAYTGEQYSETVQADIPLFRAFDLNNKLIATTRRLCRDVAHVVDVGKSALALSEVTYSPVPDISAEERAALERIWARSRIAELGELWGQHVCLAGDYYLEAYRRSDGQVTIIGHDARTVYPYYDEETWSTIEALTITKQWEEEPVVDVYGNVTEVSSLHFHQREIRADRITVTRSVNGKAAGDTPEGEGDHGLRALPVVHLRAVLLDQPEHSLWVGHGLDAAIAEADSLYSQISAISKRYADPHLVVIGPEMSGDSKVLHFGRIINISGSPEEVANAEVKYLESDLSAIKALLEAIDRLLGDVRLTLPEFLYSGASGLSGEAIRRLENRFVRKYSAIRQRIYAGLAEILSKAVSLQLRRPYDGRALLKIEAPPILPADAASEVDMLVKAAASGDVLQVDRIRGYQRLGIADPEMDAEVYRQQLEDERLQSAFSETIASGADPQES